MRISRLLLHDFRGWADLDLRPSGHVLLAGVPRAGRTDIVTALTRVLDPYGGRLQPTLSDVRQFTMAPESRATVGTAGLGGLPKAADPPTASSGHTSGETEGTAETDISRPSTTVYAENARIEVTLVELEPELEQLCDGFLEPLGTDGQVSEAIDAAPDAPFGVRLSYQITYDALTDTAEQVVFFPVRSNIETGQYIRVPAAVRRALPVVVLNAARPLQLRAEGTLRRLVTDRDADAAGAAFRGLAQSIATATEALSHDPTVEATIDDVLRAGGIGRRLGDDAVTSDRVRFQAEDGSLSAVLRAIQPALRLDEAGLLALTSHGSTATAVLNAAEALLLVASVPGAVVLGDDFGEGLDAATTEHLAAVLRSSAAQVWLTTRRPEAARGFAAEELVRLTRHSGKRAHHVLPPPVDRKDIAVRRLLHTQLLPALTAPVVCIVEGPHDLATLAAVDRRRVSPAFPLSAYGVRLVSADSGSGGGTGQIPRVAELARALGFRVLALIDSDAAKDMAATLPPIEAACDVVVRLPTGMAIERALLAGVTETHLRVAAAVLPAYGVPDPTIGKAGEDIAESLVQPLHKYGLHEQYLEALIPDAGLPPTLIAVLDAVAAAAEPHYAGPSRIDLVAPLAPDPPAPPA